MSENKSKSSPDSASADLSRMNSAKNGNKTGAAERSSERSLDAVVVVD